jgi:hypothetical protein
MQTTTMTTETTRFRVHLKGLHVGITVRAERVEFDAPTLFFWNGYQMVACFWLDDITRVDDAQGNRIEAALPVAA